MRGEHATTWLLAVVVALIAGAYLPQCGQVATGQDRAQVCDASDGDAGLMLARLCAHEATWRVADCDGIFGVLESLRQIQERREDRPRTIIHAMARYSPRFFAGLTSRSPMYRFLVPTDRGRGWARVLHRSRELVGGALIRCEARPDHWGSRTHPHDRVRAQRAIDGGWWRETSCGDTANRYFVDLRR